MKIYNDSGSSICFKIGSSYETIVPGMNPVRNERWAVSVAGRVDCLSIVTDVKVTDNGVADDESKTLNSQKKKASKSTTAKKKSDKKAEDDTEAKE